jgi:RNA polymerase sigma-70 factor (ECF subfamily)
LKDNNTILEFESDGVAFDRVYLSHYPALYSYAFTMLADKQLAEEMVHQVFLKILERKAPISIHTSIKAYLYRAVNNECLNYIKHQKVKQNHQSYTMNSMNHQTETPANKLQFRELEHRLHKAINELPLQCRIVFQMSRFEELKYAEIATELGIAVKTVENQMGKALKRLRIQLADYLPIILWLLINWM